MEKKNPKLHEFIAVEPSLKATAEKIEAETVVTFTKKEPHFDGQSRHYIPASDTEEQLGSEDKPVVETVFGKLDWTFSKKIDAMSVTFAKEIANTVAKADIEINGEIFANLPATVLLNCENSLLRVRKVLEAIPTLDPSDIWTKSTNAGEEEIFVTETRKTDRTKKIEDWVIIVPSTDKHPAQTQKVAKDVIAGKWETFKKSGRISVTEKAKMLERLDNTVRELKKARERANLAEVTEQETATKFAKTIFKFILGREVKKLDS